jgi:molybdenum cofactor biosynthesis enzyme MoaA
MRAQSISIQLSSRERCNAKCQFCISRTTPGCDTDDEMIQRCYLERLKVGLNFARCLGATHAILTGKADPTQEDPIYLCDVIRTAREYLPLVDMHTNGLLLQRSNSTLLESLTKAGLTMITFSIATFNDRNEQIMGIPQRPIELINQANQLGLLVRCSLVVNKAGVFDFEGVCEYIRKAGELGAHMVVVREVWIPDVYAECNRDVYEWNKNHVVPIGRIEDTFKEISANPKNGYGLSQRDPLPWGTPVFAVGGIFSEKRKNHGVNVTFARCDEANRGRVIKSIVHMPDGHGFRNWDHRGDVLY